MSRTAKFPNSATPGQAGAPTISLARQVIRDPVLVGACVIIGVLVSFQLVVTLLQPPWVKLATDWQRQISACVELAVVVYVSTQLTRRRSPGATSWWMMSLALLSYVIARTAWIVNDLYTYPRGVPFPMWSDLFFVLQYPLFFMAVICLPRFNSGVPRLRVILDSLLWIATATALSWYFILTRLLIPSGEPLLGTIINVAYPVGDIVVFSGLVVALMRPSESKRDQVSIFILSVAFLLLFTADTWVGEEILTYSPHVHLTGSAPDVFWAAFYGLVALAALVHLRLTRVPLADHSDLAPSQLTWRDLFVSVRSLMPFAVTLASAGLIVLHAVVTVDHGRRWVAPIMPIKVSLGLLLLATVRQVVVSLDYELLRRDQELARAHRAALEESNHRMEEFLEIASHELKTPLTSLDGNIQLVARRLDDLSSQEIEPHNFTEAISRLRVLLQRCEPSLSRLGRLVNDLLDESSIRSGHLDLKFESCDLTAVVTQTIEEVCLIYPARPIHLMEQEKRPIHVMADPERLEQVVCNYLSNAIKYSREDQPVQVRIQRSNGMARVSVRDDGPSVPAKEQPLIWERYYRAEGVDVQSGSDVGVGLGLYIAKAIVERHGGQVGMTSEPGAGSTFWFTIPLAPTTLENGTVS